MDKLSFAGHETFYCRNYWLKKGLEHVWQDNKFTGNAVIELGVGKNMVASIRFWLQAFGLYDLKGHTTELAKKVFGDKGFDPYLEDVGTIWLLHYLLVTTRRSSIYHLVFNHFRKQRIEFSKQDLIKFLVRYCSEREVIFSENSLKRDVDVFVKNYCLTASLKSIEDDFNGILHELNLLVPTDPKREYFKIENTNRDSLPAEIALFCILTKNPGSHIFSLSNLMNDEDSVSSVFALSRNGLMQKIEDMQAKYPGIIFTEDGGARVLQLKQNFDPWAILNDYYEK